MANVVIVSSVIVAAGAALDFITVGYRPAIYERFYQWWCMLSGLNLESAGERGVKRFVAIVDGIFGPRVLSVRSFASGALFALIGTALRTVVVISGSRLTFRDRVLYVGLTSALTIIPGMLIFQGSRTLLRTLRLQVTFIRLIAFGLATVLLIGAITYLSYFSLGLLTAFLTRIGFAYHLALEDVVPVIAVLVLISFGLVLIYLPVAGLPATCCGVAWIVFVVLYLSSKLAVLTKHFLRDRVEQQWVAPFTHIAGVVAAFVTISSLVLSTVNIEAMSTINHKLQVATIGAGAHHGSFLGTRLSIMAAPNRQAIASYYNQVAKGLTDFMRNGIPTPEAVGQSLRDHLPKLERQLAENGIQGSTPNKEKK